MSKLVKRANRKNGPLVPVISLILFVSTLCFTSAKWYVDAYGDIGFDAVLYTLTANLGGVEKGIIFNYIKDALLYAVVFSGILSAALFFPFRKQVVMILFGHKKLRIYPMPKLVSSLVCVLLSCAMIVQAAENVKLGEYIESMQNPSTFYQDHYADPDELTIRFPEDKRNLIYIFLESVETTFFSEEQGGALPYNIIPELYQLAEENVNFSDNQGIGGFSSLTGTTWTIGAMVSQTSGVPLKNLPREDENELGEDGSILPNITALSDILKENGYYQCLMLGSEAEFGGRQQYFSGHGVDRIYDYHTAIADGIIPEDYYVWWGMEDEYLFAYARQELAEIADREEPFAFTMLTVDTHRYDGYVCRRCGSDYEKQYENVNACSSRQVYEFVEWIKQQDFYENTTIVIAGDHLTMDGIYISENVDPSYSRHVYNCFINPFATAQNTQNRRFCALDMFPTTLGAMGCIIEGERLGLGTNLFSDKPTWIEELGYEFFQQETAAFSRYYMEKFEG